MSECDHEASIRKTPWPTGAVGPWGGEIIQGWAIECDGFQILERASRSAVIMYIIK